MITQIVKGDLLEAKEKYIAHVCNAVSNQAGGLAHYIFKRFPFSDIYRSRPFPYKATGDDFPGHCIIKGDGKKERYVINMIAQYYPGSPKNPISLLDGFLAREGYFNTCLKQILHIQDVESIAFPFAIGCGLAKGNWANYMNMIEAFAIELKDMQNGRVVIYDNEMG
jgi:O-acetyl-ADP-ribose deacetylase (regulator of RNase III)